MGPINRATCIRIVTAMMDKSNHRSSVSLNLRSLREQVDADREMNVEQFAVMLWEIFDEEIAVLSKEIEDLQEIIDDGGEDRHNRRW